MPLDYFNDGVDGRNTAVIELVDEILKLFKNWRRLFDGFALLQWR